MPPHHPCALPGSRHRIAIACLIAILLWQGACQSQNQSGASTSWLSPPATSSLPAHPVETLARPHVPTARVIPAPTNTPPVKPPTSTLSPTFTSEPTEPLTTTILFTGVIVPARCVQAKLDLLGDPDYPYEEVRELISSADLAVGVYNATMSDRIERTGCLTTWQLVGSPDNADAAARAGFDLMSVATNHIKDCGLMKSWCDFAFFDTLANLKRVGIQTVGGGADLKSALQPIVITKNGVRFGFVSLGDSKMDPVVFAAENHPGIAQLNPENIERAMTAAGETSDVVIALPHWGSEDVAIPNWLQREQASQFVASGADLVVGNHTHVVQAAQQVNNIQIFYGLGNFIFDQGLRDHRQGLILLVKFRGTRYVGYELFPTHTDGDGRVHLAEPLEAAEILQSFEQSSNAIR